MIDFLMKVQRKFTGKRRVFLAIKTIMLRYPYAKKGNFNPYLEPYIKINGVL